jgi:uncharacterized membrane protein
MDLAAFVMERKSCRYTCGITTHFTDMNIPKVKTISGSWIKHPCIKSIQSNLFAAANLIVHGFLKNEWIKIIYYKSNEVSYPIGKFLVEQIKYHQYL